MKGFWTGTVEGMERLGDVVRLTVRGISPRVGGLMGFRRIVIADSDEARRVKIGMPCAVSGTTTRRGDILADRLYSCI